MSGFSTSCGLTSSPTCGTGAFTAWSDKQIEPGSKWFDEIKTALAETSVVVMLVSADFLASDFIHEHELGPLLKEAASGGVKILWALIRDCAYQETPLRDYQAIVSPPGKPFAQMSKPERDTAWRKVCEAIKQVAKPPLAGSPDSAGPVPVSPRETVPADPKPSDGQELIDRDRIVQTQPPRPTAPAPVEFDPRPEEVRRAIRAKLDKLKDSKVARRERGGCRSSQTRLGRTRLRRPETRTNLQ